MHEMQTISIEDLVSWCVSLSVTRLRLAKTAERMEMRWRRLPIPLWGGEESVGIT